MSEEIKKLVAVEFVIAEERTITYPAGHKYIYLRDPETGRYYWPRPGWAVFGDDLGGLFDEIKSGAALWRS